jgi:integrase/recombinase XerC
VNRRWDERPPLNEMIEAYLESLRRRSFAAESIRGRRDILVQLDKALPFGVARTNRDELERWLHDNNTWSDNTKATYWSAMSSAYAFWADPNDPWLDGNPTDGMAPCKARPGVARPVTDSELFTILAKADEPYRLWARIAAYQGLRCIEIAGLDREHITQERLRVVRGKGGRGRVHDTDPGVWEAVKDLPPGPIAPGGFGTGRASANTVSRTAGRHFQHKLGLEGVTMHRLRHWLGVNTQKAYKDVRVTMAVLGHRSLQSTQIYTDATFEQQSAARAMLPRPDRTEGTA